MLKIVASLLILVSMPMLVLFFFGAASGGRQNPGAMYRMWAAAAVGGMCGIGALAAFALVEPVHWAAWLAAAVAIWPLPAVTLHAVRRRMKSVRKGKP